LCFSLVLSLHAQKVVFNGTYVNYGSLFVCAAGANTPQACSETLSLSFRMTAAVTFGAPKVLTMGQPNLDFTLAGNSCTGQKAAFSSCSLQVMMKPRLPGLRAGAVQLTDSAGNLLATTFLRGIGAGPKWQSILPPSPL
jgi:hypothetical protein